MSKPPESKKLMRSLGEFFGHIVRGVRTDPSAGPTVVRKESTEQVSPDGAYTLRRTVIEEVQFHAPVAGQVPPGSSPGPNPGDRPT